MAKQINLTSVVSLFHRLINSYRHGIVQSCNQAGIRITYGEIIILLRLREQDDLSRGDLARSLLKDKAYNSRIISQCIHKGWIKSQRGNKDRRTVFTQLTPDGRQVAQSIFSLVLEYEKSACNNISQNDLDVTNSILHQIIENIRK